MKELPGAIGRVVGTEKKPNTPHEFHFWTAPDSPVGIGTLVKVRIEDRGSGIDGGHVVPRTIYGIVTDGASYTDLQTALHDYIGSEGNPNEQARAATLRPEIRV